MTIESLNNYCEESIELCQHVLDFIKRKQSLKEEYVNSMIKLLKSTEDFILADSKRWTELTRKEKNQKGSMQLSSNAGNTLLKSVTGKFLKGKIGAIPDSNENLAVDSKILVSPSESSLWKAIISMLREEQEFYLSSSKSLLSVCSEQIITPLEHSIAEMGNRRKQLEFDAQLNTKLLQDAYQTLKKEKETWQSLKCIADEQEAVYLKVQHTYNSRPKDVERQAAKFSNAKEKAEAAYRKVVAAEAGSKKFQEIYFDAVVPSLMKAFRETEKNRIETISSILVQHIDLERSYYATKSSLLENIAQEYESKVSLEEDIQAFETEHMDNRIDDQVSVKSLVAPTKASRLKYCKAEYTPIQSGSKDIANVNGYEGSADNNNSGNVTNTLLDQESKSISSWKTRYVVLMADQRRLYIFENESSHVPKSIINLNCCSIFSTDYSLFGIENVFQLISYSSFSEGNTNPQQPIAEQQHFFAARNPNEFRSWIKLLKDSITCCSTCDSIKKFREFESSETNLLLESPLTVFKRLKLSLTEARDIPTIEGFIKTGGGYYCVISYVTSQTQNGNMNESMLLESKRSSKVLSTGSGFSSNFSKSLNADLQSGGFVVKQARTTVKYGSCSPFWGEEFFLDDIPPCVKVIRVSLMSKKVMSKDIEISRLDINLSIFNNLSKIDDWIQMNIPMDIRRTSNSSDCVESGLTPAIAIRLSANLTLDKVLVDSVYYPVFNRLVFATLSDDESDSIFSSIPSENLLNIALLIVDIIPSKEEYAKLLVQVLCHRKCDEVALKNLISQEINSTTNPNIIFRGNSLATKAVDYYMKLVGTQYLHNTLKTSLQTLYKSKESLEIDPHKLEKPEDLKKRVKRLLMYVDQIFEMIKHSVESCPIEIRKLFSWTFEIMEKKFGVDFAFLSVSGFVFLRFFCPAILNPKLFGMLNEHPEQQSARNFTLIAKVIQSIANLTEFGPKEPHMAVLNEFTKYKMADMRLILSKFSNLPALSHVVHLSSAYELVPYNFSRCMASLTGLMTLSLSQIQSLASMTSEEDSSRIILFQLIDQLLQIQGAIQYKYKKWKAFIGQEEMISAPAVFKSTAELQIQKDCLDANSVTPLKNFTISTKENGKEEGRLSDIIKSFECFAMKTEKSSSSLSSLIESSTDNPNDEKPRKVNRVDRLTDLIAPSNPLIRFTAASLNVSEDK